MKALRKLKQKHLLRGTAADTAYWTIREALREGVLGAGERLLEVELAATLEMSRTPVREALRRLEHERFLVNVPRRGLIVPEVTAEETNDLFEIREVLEGLAARRAARYLSPAELGALQGSVERMEKALQEEDTATLAEASAQFHNVLSSRRKSRLNELISLLHETIAGGLQQATASRTDAAVAEHRAIYEAIAAHDGELAETLMRSHVRNALQAHLSAQLAK